MTASHRTLTRARRPGVTPGIARGAGWTTRLIRPAEHGVASTGEDTRAVPVLPWPGGHDDRGQLRTAWTAVLPGPRPTFARRRRQGARAHRYGTGGGRVRVGPGVGPRRGGRPAGLRRARG